MDYSVIQPRYLPLFTQSKNRAELCKIYDVSIKVLNTWLEKIGFIDIHNGYRFTPAEMEKILTNFQIPQKYKI